MRVRFACLVGASLLTSCTAAPRDAGPATPTPRPGLVSRDLSEKEKLAIGKALAQNLKDPDSAQYRWVAVKYAPGSTSTEYCGQVNSKNSYGGYAGFQMFHSVLFSDAKGQYTSALLDDIIVDNAHGDDLSNNVKYLGMCIAAGY